MTPTVAVLVAIGMVIVVPLGLPLLRTPGLQRMRRLWPLVGATGATSLVLPPSPTTVLLTGPYLLLCTAAAAVGVRRVWCSRTLPPTTDALRELLALTALVSLPVAALSLVAERRGWALLGFEPEVLALTVAHFHYAGFAAATLTGLTLVRAPGRFSSLGAFTVPAGTALVAFGHFAGRSVELLGALVLTIGLLAVSWTVLGRIRPQHRSGRRLLRVAASVAPLSMALALWWAVGRVTGWPHPDLAAMALTHGILNAVGLSLCGLLGWRLLRPVPV